MSRFSVKKPYTVIVGVIIVLIMGYMAFTNLSTDLLPSMNLPYAVVLTTYGGASPEEVEEVVTKPIESSMATVSNISHITSTSSENFSMVVLEFNNNANMDSVTIEMRESLDMLASYWPDTVGSPIIMKMNPSMLPVMMLAVSGEGMDIGEVSKLVNESVTADIESMDGVASVTASGLLETSVQVIIREDKVAALNQKLLDKIGEEFDEAGEEIENGRDQLADGRAQLEQGRAAANAAMNQAQAEIDAGVAGLNQGQAEIDNKKAELESGKALIADKENELAALRSELETQLAALNEQEAALNALPDQLAELEAQEAQLLDGKEKLETAICLLEKQEVIAQAALQAADSEEVKAREQTLIDQKAELEAQLAAIQADPNLSEEEKTAQLAAVNDEISCTDTQLKAIDAARQLAAEQLASAQVNLEQSRGQLSEAAAAQAALADGKAQLEAAIAAAPEAHAALAEGKAQIDAALVQLADGENQMNVTREQLAAGEQALVSAQQQLDSGRVQLASAQNQLDAGRVQAANEMSAAEAKINEGEAQLNEAESQMEEAREEAEDAVHMEEVITTDMIKGILAAQNFSMPAGYITEDNVSYLVRIGDKLPDLETAENLVLMDLSSQGLGTVYLKDVADVIVVDNSSEIYAKMDGENAVLLSVEKQTDYSTADVARMIREYMDSDQLAEYGLSMTALMDQGVYIDMVIESVLSNLVIGGILAIIILIFFLKDIRPTAVVAISIPVSVVFALALMYFTGVTMNIISLSGLALGVGMLVDNSIVVIENIYRMRNEGASAKEAAIEGAKQVTGAIIASTLTTVCIWTPIIFVQGMTKQLFMDLVLTIAYSLLASLIVALTVVPMMASGILDKTMDKKHPLFDRVTHAYGKALAWSLRHKFIVLAIVLALFIGSTLGIMSKGMEFMGDADSTQVSVSIQMPKDTPLEDTAAMADEIMNRILTMEDVDHVGVMTGTSLSVMSASGSAATDQATMYVILKEDRTLTSQQAAAQIEDMMADLDCEVTANGSTMDMSALGGSGISVMIKGRDIDTLQAIANDFAAALEQIEGTVEVSNGQEDPVPELRITVDKEKAMLNYLTVAQVYQQISAMIAEPAAATTVTVDQEDLEITVIDEKDSTMNRADVGRLVLKATNAEGEAIEVPLKDIADIHEATGLSAIQRDAQQRYISVSAGVADGYNATLLARDFKDAIADYELPDGYSIQFAGEDQSTNEAMMELVKLLALGIVIMYLIMVAQFQSVLSPLIVLFTIPLAFTGGFLSLLMTGNILSVIAMVGFVMLCGIIVNNGIVFIDYANQLREAGAEKTAALIETGQTRLRPILMTALTTILAMSTMALGLGSGSDMVQPMAIVTIGGLIYGTFMTLFVVPVIYDLFVHVKRGLNDGN